ncbi:hypothetical protein [Microtetraspora sp. NBRC 16547]|uniref:hypothetical protein n=1 Tax=Microtetraspora sp. NBRC 16547 TaxID=3030993 RepID=UPI00249FDC26|nr:hypothetical protein [Microtetraspora sp. NBRC 16547]GLW96812.1 hypothetical protein Misp02_08990 [Microtetraspora sp. NBRC 16547]
MQLRGSWVPLLGFGLMSLAAVPVARYAYNFGAHGRNVLSYPAFAYAELKGLCVAHIPGAPCDAHEFDGAVLRFVAWGIWFAVLPLVWLAFARWYRHRGEIRGILPRRGSWLWAMGVTFALVVAAFLALFFSRGQPGNATFIENAYACPWYLVGVGLLVLGLLERRWITAMAGLCHAALLSAYLAASWGTGWLPWAYPADPGWTDGPQFKALLLTAVLLVAGFAEWRSGRPRRAPHTTALITTTT